MDMVEAMGVRHSVRSYTDRRIEGEVRAKLESYIAQCNAECGLHMQLVCDEPKAFSGMLAHYGKFSGVRNYIALAGRKGAGLDEECGYWGEKVVLFAQTLGLNSWWVGGMFNAKGAARHLTGTGLRVNGVIAVGYGATQGVPHKSKAPSDVSSYEGATPQWFQNGVSALLLAPTALNKQAYHVRGKGSKVTLTCDSGHFAGIDLGIGKYHFEVGAGKDSFEWADAL